MKISKATTMAIARVLGTGWTVDKHNPNEIHGPEGAALSVDWWAGALDGNGIQIKGLLPHVLGHGHMRGIYQPFLRLHADERSAVAAARAVKKRLLPKYLPLLRQLQEAEKKDQEDNRKIVEIEVDCEAIFGRIIGCESPKVEVAGVEIVYDEATPVGVKIHLDGRIPDIRRALDVLFGSAALIEGKLSVHLPGAWTPGQIRQMIEHLKQV